MGNPGPPCEHRNANSDTGRCKVCGWRISVPQSFTLPTEPGSVIGFSLYNDGNHFGAALLDWNDDGPCWYMAGFQQGRTPEEMTEFAGITWHYIGAVPRARP